jgi:catechol 2,3-dioxygenase-like lactoylglutathione lyase family enzyme
MSIVKVKKLSHVALKVTDIAAQTQFYSEICGLGETARDDAGQVYMRCNADHHSVVLIPSDESGLDHFALEVGGPAEVAATAQALDRAGISYEANGSHELGQGPSLRLRDPDGFVVELLGGMEQVNPTYGPRAVQPREIGHVTLLVDDPKVSVEFYTQILGFRISDWFEDVFAWLRCNPQHHTVAVARLARVGMHHFAFNVVNFSEIAHLGDHLMRNGRHFLYGPGRHGPGNNQFAYLRDLDGHIIEYTCDSIQVWDEENYRPKVWRSTQKWVNVWGQDPPEEFLQ